MGDVEHYPVMFTFVPLRLVPGMGWPPCGRTMVRWWSQKNVAALCQCGTVRVGNSAAAVPAGDGTVQ